MRLNFFCFFVVISSLAFFSCQTTKGAKEHKRELPESVAKDGVSIMGKGEASALILRNFFVAKNPSGNSARAFRLAKLYIEEAKAEGVNSDVAFIQMCLETGWLQFGNLVTEKMNNFCGLGAIDSKNPGASFPTEKQGVRAHIQHLKGYGSKEPVSLRVVDPRYRYISPKGKAPTVLGLAGTWAADKDYGKKLMSLYAELYGMM